MSGLVECPVCHAEFDPNWRKLATASERQSARKLADLSVVVRDQARHIRSLEDQLLAIMRPEVVGDQGTLL